MSHRTRIGPAVALVLVTVLSGCSPAQESAPAHPSFGGEVAEATWRVPMRALAQPVVVDGVAVVVVQARQDELDIVALDAATGEEKWRYPYSPGAGLADVPVVVNDGEGGKVVVFQRPPQDLQMNPGMKLPLAAVDLTTGELVSQSEPHTIDTRLVECADGYDACNWSYDVDDDQTLRFAVRDGAINVKAKPAQKLPDGVPSTFHGGYYHLQGTPARIGRVVDGKKAWEKSAQFMFTTPGGFGTYSWDWRDEDGVLLMWVTDFSESQWASYSSGGKVTFDLAEARVVAIDQENGNLLWQDRGVTRWCGPWPGSTLAHTDPGDADAPPTRCRMTGTNREAQKGKAEYTIESYIAEGYDLRTGKTTWSQELPSREGKKYTLYDPDTSRPQPYMPDHAVVEIDGRTQLLSIQSGKTIAAPDGQVFLCGARRDYKYAVAIDGRRTHETRKLAFPCTGDGNATDRPVTDAMLRQVAVPAGEDSYLYATEKELIGYHLDQPNTFLGIELPF
jgi:outer membrane protein assembly factor BamB